MNEIKVIKNKMIDMVIRVYGFEHEKTIKFCESAESPHVSLDELRLMFELLIDPIF